MEVKELRIGRSTNVSDLGASIAHSIQENPTTPLSLCCIGADSVNQAIKGVVNASSRLVTTGKVAYIMPTFANRADDSGNEISVMLLSLKISIL